ncbi:uncharacterized protein LOC113494293 [Trichoplusia ni]|uniref:Uncharacterized protein LOC113494293 n=1 Tax=Trichoplusia ni TaxID=7111 RepID=A0A7E5VJB6_TRINI|nr:uncharacterized protein LOC113494293 [Trichoplusia ni]XP_026728374.1 uncharacterized protein LOC113494293 [Trichoplusia ni]
MEEKKKKGSWESQSLQTAIDKVLSKKLSVRQAAMQYNIPKSTIHDKIKAINRGEEVTMKPKLGRFTSTFSAEYEQVLVDHIKDLSNRCMPLMKKEFLKLAYDLAETMKIPHRFNKEKGSAGKHFYYDFMKKHSDISLRAPESTSMMRAVGFNKPQVDIFYDNLEKLMQQYKFTPSRIYNCDETGVSCVHKHQKVLAPKAIRQVGKLTSAERGKNITVLFCMSANGHYIPPFFVFPRQRMNERLMMNAPGESIGVAQPKGWMNSDFFLQYLRIFMKHTQPTKENPVLLLLDGHCSHKTLAVINFCRENHIHLMSSPPHTTHKLQPLDRTFMKPFKDAYSQRCDLWMRTNAGRRITDYDIAGLVKDAFIKVARLDIAVSGFKCTGIHPFDRHLFSDIDYLAADMTNIPLEQTETSSNALNNEQAVVISNSIVEEQMKESEQSISEPINTSPKPSTSSAPDLVQIIHNLSPLPDAAKKRTAARKRKSERSEILTSSPYKKLAEEKENEKNTKDKKKEIKSKIEVALGGKGKQTKGKSVDKRKEATKVKPNEKKRREVEPLTEISNTNKTICVVCLETSEEDWIQCSSCLGWVHEACADIPESGDGYICDRCRLF